MEVDYEVCICGAGPVGLALACMLVQRGLPASKTLLIDASELEKSCNDPRTIALSYGSRQILQQIGAWPEQSCAIEQIHVSRRGHFGRTLIDRHQHQLPALGYVCRYGHIISPLAARCTQLQIPMLRPWQMHNCIEHADHVHLDLQQGTESRQIRSRILVQAEGGLFHQQSEKKLHRDYEQSALIAEVLVTSPQQHKAFERFTDAGPLALLPLPPGNNANYALVWCVKPDQAEQLLALDEAGFLRELQQAFGERLGRFCASSPRQAFRLGLNAQAQVSARMVAIGNAAQTLHPVAGQGLNLGLRDASVLARCLARATSAQSLQDFIHKRDPDRRLTVQLTDTMARIFTREAALPQSWLGLSLGLFDLLPLARNTLANMMMFGHRQ